MSSVVKYNDSCIAPVQAISINKGASVLNNGQCVRPLYNISLEGTLLANYGSPTSSGTFGCFSDNHCETLPQDEWLDSLLVKQCALSDLFSESYKKLELGTQFVAYPRVANFSINDTTNPQFFTYSIELEADTIYCGGETTPDTGCPGILSYEDNWEINYDDSENTMQYGQNRLFKISHNCSAVGIGIRSSGNWIKSPLECARDFVKSKTGGVSGVENIPLIDGIAFTGGNLIYNGTKQHKLYNYYESHSFDKVSNTYSISESWIAATGDFVETYSVDISDDSSSICPTVSIQGTIRGFELRSSGNVALNDSKYKHADDQLQHLINITGFHERCEDMSGYTLQVEPISNTFTKNKFTGEIGYNYTFKKLPVKMLPGTKFEKISVSNTWGEDIYATLNLLGKGEIIQPIGGNRLNKTSLSIDAVYPCANLDNISPTTGIGIFGPRFYIAPSGGRDYAADLQALINKYKDQIETTFEPDFIVVESQNENFDRNDGSYNYSLTWIWQLPGVCD